MPGKTIPHFLVFFLWSPLVFLQAQPSSLNCAFDGMQRRQLAQDLTYQRRHREVERSLLQRAQQHFNNSNGGRRSENAVYTIPVVVHLFYPPGTAEGSMSRPTYSQIRRSIERLSDGFRNRGDYSGDPLFTNAGIEGADVGIEFRLAAYDPQGLPAGGIQSYATQLASEPIDRQVDGVEVLDSLRRLSGWPSTRYLNIYVLPGLCNKAGDCPIGFSYQAAAHGLDYDGVYVFSKALHHETEVLIHEVGHYFNLYHTFESGCGETDCLTGGDRVCDTPPDCYPANCSGRIPNCLLEERQNTCHRDTMIHNSPFTSDVEDIYENFMDSGFWKCFNSFTPGQRLRMRDALLGFRSSLLEPMVKTQPDSCRFTSTQLLSAPECLSPGDTGIALIRIDYRHPPDSGQLIVNDRPFAFNDSSLILPVPVAADTPYGYVEAYFSADTTCRLLADSLLTAPPCPQAAAWQCAAATTLPICPDSTCLPVMVTGLRSATGLSGLPNPDCPRLATGALWYRMPPPENGRLLLELFPCGNAMTGLAVYAGCQEALIDCISNTNGPSSRMQLLLTDLPGDSLLLSIWSLSDSAGIRAYSPDCGHMNISLAVSPISCSGQSDGAATILAADTSRYSYRWNTGARLPVISNLPIGDYSVVVTDPFQCEDTLSFSLEMPAPLRGYTESTSSLPDTALGSIRVFVSGGTPPYAYQLENSSYQDGPLFEHLAPGNYRYNVVDGHGCLWNDAATVGLTTSTTPPPIVKSLRLYPNPVGDELHIDIDLERSAEGRLRLFDPLGRLIRQQRFSGSRQVRERWAVAPLPEGLYLLRLELDGGIWVRKVLVQRF